jgi:two-component system CitB family response regulator/CitB family two-component system response regulator MalR
VSAEQTDPCRILVAEDDPALRKLLVTVLRRRHRTEIEAATNGAEAIERLSSRPCLNVLVLDLMMRTKSGWDVIEWLADHEDRRPNSVIVVSAADRAILQQLDPRVVNSIIFKPFDVFQFSAYVKSACDLDHRDRRKRRLVGDLK